MVVADYFEYINWVAPFSSQERYDNSGFLIGDLAAEVKSVVVTLDVTCAVVAEAVKQGANLIISHHPVIFDPLKAVHTNSVVYSLIQNGINVICAHTNFDIYKMSDLMLKKLGFSTEGKALEPTLPDGNGFGKIVELGNPISYEQVLERTKKAFGTETLRYTKGKDMIGRVAVCSGSGGSLLAMAMAAECDCLITGDVKWDVFVDAMNNGFMLIDAGHYATEFIMCEYLRDELAKKFPAEKITVAKNSADVLYYSNER